MKDKVVTIPFVAHEADMNRMERTQKRIMAIALLTNRDWHEVYEELSYLANKDSLMMDSVIFIEDYLDDRFPRECHYSKTIGEFANEYPYGKYAVTTSGHITAIIDGIIYDTFDPSNRIMRCAWRID